MSTKVLFPHFQMETSPERPINERKLVWVAPEADWLMDDELHTVLNPRTVTEETRYSARGGWWGVYHKVVEKATIGKVAPDIFGNGANGMFRYRLLEHDYLWDEQALSGRASEVILEQYQFGGGSDTFDAIAKLLYQRPAFKTQASQRLLLLDGDGVREPRPLCEIDDYRDYCLLLMGEIATSRFELRQPSCGDTQ